MPKYEYDARIRFSEVDHNQELTMMALLNHFQDCSTFQSEELGIGVKYLSAQKKAWVLNSWQIDVKRMPKLCDEVVVGTLPYEIKKFMGFRNFYMKDKATDEMLAMANSIWTFLDLEKLRPIAVNQDIIEAYAVDEKLDMEYLGRKIIFEGEMTRREEPVTVKMHHLDANMHVNNGQYVMIAKEYLPDGFDCRRLMVEYKKSALLDDVMIPEIYESENSIGVALKSEDGIDYACVNFYR